MATNSHPATLALPLQPTDHVQGSEHARVTVVEYGDFECPSCKVAAPTIKMLLDQFPNKLRFAFRHFPLEEPHPHALIYLQKVREHIDSARRSHIRATPTFFVNGVVQDVSYGMLALHKAVESAVGRAHQR